MKKEAILHVSESPMAEPLSPSSFFLRLRLAREDEKAKVVLHYGEKYCFQDKRDRVEIPLARKSREFSYFETTICLQSRRLAYIFEISAGDEHYYLSERGLTAGYDFAKAYEDFFQFSYVHEEDVFHLPDWSSKAVFYQIFPDRFAMGKKEKDTGYINLKWGDKPTNKSFAGGDIKGIADRLDYLADLGINALYLTPIFRSNSYHKYDTIDYMEIDPELGTEEDLRALIAKAHAKGIRIVLDAVFNHISSDSPFFQDVIEKGRSSPYYHWFFIRGERPDTAKGNYEYFSVCPYMPKLNPENSECAAYLIGVARHYLRLGIDGWRLDVADEVPHSFWRNFRAAIKAEFPSSIIIGEHWHNAHSFLSGNEFDGVMNYPLTYVIADYLIKGELTAEEAAGRLEELYVRYRPSMLPAMLNLLDSHDTHRFLTLAKGRIETLDAALAILFFYPGMPCLYYGTEIPMEGGYDPDCRRCFPWERANDENAHKKLLNSLILLRNSDVLAHGSFRAEEENGLLKITRSHNGKSLVLYVNGSRKAHPISSESLIASRYEGGYLEPFGFLIRR